LPPNPRCHNANDNKQNNKTSNTMDQQTVIKLLIQIFIYSCMQTSQRQRDSAQPQNEIMSHISIQYNNTIQYNTQ